LLDDEYKRVKECTDNNILSAKVLGVMCDGWTNLRNESIVNFVVTTPNPVFFINQFQLVLIVTQERKWLKK